MKIPSIPICWKTAVATVALLFLMAAPVYAELGGDEASIQTDQARIQAMRYIARGNTYSVHEMRTAPGTVVREYVSPAGKVFAVSWEGPAIPDLRQILGSYFAHLETAQFNRRGRGPMAIREPGLVLHSGGHMRAFVGQAYVPDLLPEGVGPEVIR